MCLFKKPSSPAPPPAAPAPAVSPTRRTADRAASAAVQPDNVRRKRRQTLLTGGQGVQGEAQMDRKTLLGQ